MSDILTLDERINAESASMQQILGGFQGQRVSALAKGIHNYDAKFQEALKIITGVMTGRRPDWHLREAMTTSDFPLLFADVIDRQLLARYETIPKSYPMWAKIMTVRDFRKASVFSLTESGVTLPKVPANTEYTESKWTESKKEIFVEKYGEKVPVSWEMLMNDDLGAFQSLPLDMADKASNTEEYYATSLICDANGPDATFFSADHNNLITPALSADGLDTAVAALAKIRSLEAKAGRGIDNTGAVLVVPPALERTAQKLIAALEIRSTSSGGTTTQEIITSNINANLKYAVAPFIPSIVSDYADAAKCWFFFSDPNKPRQAIRVAKLRGYETPGLYRKTSNQESVGGGATSAMDGDFDTDSIQWKVRQMFGGVAFDERFGVASTGAGS